MKKYLSIAFAALALAACAEKIDDTNDPAISGEIEESYIAINLTAADPDTRADGATYQDGLAAERTVNTAYFFFFQNGEPFSVNVSGNAVTAPGVASGVNYLQASLQNTNPASGEAPNVSDIKEVVLLLKNYKGQYPNQIIAVLNWTPGSKAYTLADLRKETPIKDNGYFVMSNAVYADGADQVVEATPLTISNIFPNENDAKEKPVTIHVERIAAKVTVTTASANGVTFDVNKSVTPVGGSETKVYAQITGWELFNDYQSSYLLKNINPAAWGTDNVGFNWNDKNFYRSYWAISPTGEFENNAFTWNGGFMTALNTEVAAGTYADNTYTYCGENTYRSADARTKVILKAKLVKKVGEAYQPLELAKWYGADYVSEGDLLIAVANTLKNSIYYKKSDTEKVGIEPADLQCVVGGGTNAPAGVKATEVYFQLSTAGEAKEWYVYDSSNGFTAKGDADINDHLKTVPAATLYNDGQTYYYFDIKHLGGEDTPAEYGIVRNHIYSININSIGGYGSPVYEPTSQIETPEYPDTPEETESFVAAEVRILSWRLVSQGVDIQPQS